jgi:hypothetical protein
MPIFSALPPAIIIAFFTSTAHTSISSLIPFLLVYAGWLIQKFWLLALINFAIGRAITIPMWIVSELAQNQVFSLTAIVDGTAVSIAISVLLVRHFAREYNQRIAADSQSRSKAPAPYSEYCCTDYAPQNPAFWITDEEVKIHFNRSNSSKCQDGA